MMKRKMLSGLIVIVMMMSVLAIAEINENGAHTSMQFENMDIN